MRSTPLLLLCLLSSLMEVHSQNIPYVSFMGNILPNNSNVDLSLVGQDQTGSDSNTVQCHTDLTTCCRRAQGFHNGDWFAPGNDTRLSFSSEEGDIYEDRQNMVVHLLHRNNATGPSGIYRCVIATNAVHDDSDQSVGDTVYVELRAHTSGEDVPTGMTTSTDSSNTITLGVTPTKGPATPDNSDATTLGGQNSVENSTAIIIGVVCSLVFLSVGVLLGAVGLYLIQRAWGKLYKPPSPSPPPVPLAVTYEEVDVSKEVTSTQKIQLNTNEAYALKENIPTSHNTAYGQVQL